MLSKLLPLLALCTSLIGISYLSAEIYQNDVKPELHYVIANEIFAGDKHGDYRGDIVAILDDGSKWKIHPTRKKKFLAWDQSDIIHVGLKTSYYFLTRDHHFYLINQTKNEKIKVMMVGMPQEALRIMTTDTYVDGHKFGPQTYTNPLGRTHVVYTVQKVYAVNVRLSDGSVWKVKDNIHVFLEGYSVYMGTDMKKNTGAYFLISGNGIYYAGSLAEKIN